MILETEEKKNKYISSDNLNKKSEWSCEVIKKNFKLKKLKGNLKINCCFNDFIRKEQR